jgi:rubredoxin
MSDKKGLPAVPQPGRKLVTTTRPDPAKRADLLARIKARDPGSSPGQAFAAPRPLPPALRYVPPPQMAVSAPERVRLHITCGATGGRSLGLGERRDDVVRLVDSEPLPPGRGNEVAGLLAGSYRLEMADTWVCPFCRVPPQRFWNCNCAAAGGSLHTDCGGGSLLFCQCGKREQRHFHDVEKIQARGASVASASLVVGRSIVRR